MMNQYPIHREKEYSKPIYAAVTKNLFPALRIGTNYFQDNFGDFFLVFTRNRNPHSGTTADKT